MNWLLDCLARFIVWLHRDRGDGIVVRGIGPSSPDTKHQQEAPSVEALPTSDYPALDSHQIDKDALWRMYQERRELEKQRRFLDDLLNPPDYIEPFRHSGEPSQGWTGADRSTGPLADRWEEWELETDVGSPRRKRTLTHEP